MLGQNFLRDAKAYGVAFWEGCGTQVHHLLVIFSSYIQILLSTAMQFSKALF
jgi:hypothetical protein